MAIGESRLWKNNEIQDIVNSLKRMEAKNDLIKNNTQSEKGKSLQNLIDELMELDVKANSQFAREIGFTVKIANVRCRTSRITGQL